MDHHALCIVMSDRHYRDLNELAIDDLFLRFSPHWLLPLSNEWIHSGSLSTSIEPTERSERRPFGHFTLSSLSKVDGGKPSAHDHRLSFRTSPLQCPHSRGVGRDADDV